MHGRVEVFHDFPADESFPLFRVDSFKFSCVQEHLSVAELSGGQPFFSHTADDVVLATDVNLFGAQVVVEAVAIKPLSP